ncbi:hypothetical protein C0995_016606 [Termitomyces sp. Mi166|nr:hypothetical protein C0995_016606 [Termitomyces sp. Mi166\
MFPVASLRIAPRRVFTAPVFTRTAGVTLKWVPRTLTRSFIMSVAHAEPASTKSKTPTKAKKSVPKKKVAEKTVKAKAKKAAKKPVKKPVKATKLVIPRSVKIPSYGLSPYIYFVTKIFKPEFAQTSENFLVNNKAAGAAWHALPESEKQKYRDICSAAHVEAAEKRQAYINSLEPAILRELNRRRVAKGKSKLHKTMQGPPNAYVSLNGSMIGHRWMKEYQVSHPEVFKVRGFGSKIGALWRDMSAEEKQASVPISTSARAEHDAQKKA